MRDEVLVVGDLMVDVVVRPSGPLHPRSDTPSSVELHGGGSAANTACWVAATGRPVRLVAAVGDDALGRLALADLEAAAVTFAGHVAPGRTTGTCVVLLDETGERTMLPDRGANEDLRPAAVEAALATPPAWLHLSGYALLGEGSRAAARSALQRATATGVPWSVDAASAAPLRTVGPGPFLTWIDSCALLLANDDELAALGGEAAAVAAAGEVVTKHGPRGASWTDGRGSVTVPAPPVEVVSAVGAGDAFDAGYLDARLSGAPPEAALTAGGQLAARVLARPGARP
jgi:sugar/nucleoside kinase (ribokinase family)